MLWKVWLLLVVVHVGKIAIKGRIVSITMQLLEMENRELWTDWASTFGGWL